MRRERRIAKVHVQSAVSGGWVVRLSGRTRALRRFVRKRQALSLGRERARRYGVPLYVHRSDGTVERVVS